MSIGESFVFRLWRYAFESPRLLGFHEVFVDSSLNGFCESSSQCLRCNVQEISNGRWDEYHNSARVHRVDVSGLQVCRSRGSWLNSSRPYCTTIVQAF